MRRAKAGSRVGVVWRRQLVLALVLGCVHRTVCEFFMQESMPSEGMNSLSLTYHATIRAWRLTDAFASAHDRMFVQLCAGAWESCDTGTAEALLSCAQREAAHNASAWRSVPQSPTDCGGSDIVDVRIRAEVPNKLLVDSDLTQLYPFSRPANGSGHTLRVRFVYETFIPHSTLRHVRAHAYDVVLTPLKRLADTVLVRSECGARGLTSPGLGMAPVLGGSTLAVYLVNRTGVSERYCAWSCTLPFVKHPWYAQAELMIQGRNSSAGGPTCTELPVRATVVGLSFLLGSRLSLHASAALSLPIMAVLDEMSLQTQYDLQTKSGEWMVLYALRHSVYNTHSLRKLSHTFSQDTALHAKVVINEMFMHTQQTAGTLDDWLVDALFITDDNHATEHAEQTVLDAVYRINISRVAPELLVTGVFDVDVEFVHHTHPQLSGGTQLPPFASVAAGAVFISMWNIVLASGYTDCLSREM